MNPDSTVSSWRSGAHPLMTMGDSFPFVSGNNKRQLLNSVIVRIKCHDLCSLQDVISVHLIFIVTRVMCLPKEPAESAAAGMEVSGLGLVIHCDKHALLMCGITNRGTGVGSVATLCAIFIIIPQI